MAHAKRIRHTRQRETILEELMRFESHPTADELYERVRRRLPRISLGTVYRNLELLAQEGMIGRLAQSGARMRFDGRHGDHTHIRCICCGRIDDVPAAAAVSEKDRRLARKTGYRLLERRIQYLGVCPACRTKKKGD